MTVAVWSGGPTDDVAHGSAPATSPWTSTARSSLLGWWLATDLGRAAYHLSSRGVAPTLVGAVLFDVRYPPRPLTCCCSWSR